MDVKATRGICVSFTNEKKKSIKVNKASSQYVYWSLNSLPLLKVNEKWIYQKNGRGRKGSKIIHKILFPVASSILLIFIILLKILALR